MKLLLVIASVLACSIQASKDAEDTYLDHKSAFDQLVSSDKCDLVPDAGKVADGPTDGMNNFTRESFYIDTAKGDSFVMFMLDGSDFCQKVEVTWKKVAKYFENNDHALIGQVNCNKEHVLCTEQGILGYPMVKYYHEGNEIESQLISSNSDDLISYVHKKLQQPPAEVKDNAKELTNETVKEVLSTGITFLKMYHPDCGFCKRMERAWKQLSNEDFSGVDTPVLIAKLNCKKYETACLNFGCRGFPTMLLYIDGVSIASYMAERTDASLKEFIYQMLSRYQPNHHRSSRIDNQQEREFRDLSPRFRGL